MVLHTKIKETMAKPIYRNREFRAELKDRIEAYTVVRLDSREERSSCSIVPPIQEHIETQCR